MNLTELLLLSAQSSPGGAGHPSTSHAGMSIPCKVQWEIASSLQGSAALRSRLHSSMLYSPLIKSQLPTAQLVHCPGPLASHLCPGPVSPPGAQPSVRQQQSCPINLSAPGQQCVGLFSIYLGLSTVSGSKTAAPVSNLCLSVILETMLSQLQPTAGGRQPGHCHELPPPSLELRGQQCAPGQSTYPCMPWDQHVLIDWGWGQVAEGFALPSTHFSRDPSAGKKSCAIFLLVLSTGLGISCRWEEKQGGNDWFSTGWRRSVLLLKGSDSLLPDRPDEKYQFWRMTRLYGLKSSFHPPHFPGVHHQAIKPPLA